MKRVPPSGKRSTWNIKKLFPTTSARNDDGSFSEPSILAGAQDDPAGLLEGGFDTGPIPTGIAVR